MAPACGTIVQRREGGRETGDRGTKENVTLNKKKGPGDGTAFRAAMYPYQPSDAQPIRAAGDLLDNVLVKGQISSGGNQREGEFSFFSLQTVDYAPRRVIQGRQCGRRWRGTGREISISLSAAQAKDQTDAVIRLTMLVQTSFKSSYLQSTQVLDELPKNPRLIGPLFSCHIVPEERVCWPN